MFGGVGRTRALLLAMCVALAVAAALPPAAVAKVAVKRGAHYGARIFPANAFTVRDRGR